MTTKIQKWGNSQGLRISKSLLADAHINVGDAVDVTAKDGIIVISPVKKIRGRHYLKDLVEAIPDNYESEEIDWGKPVGKEVW